MDRYLARFRISGGQERMGMGRYSGKADRCTGKHCHRQVIKPGSGRLVDRR